MEASKLVLVEDIEKFDVTKIVEELHYKLVLRLNEQLDAFKKYVLAIENQAF